MDIHTPVSQKHPLLWLHFLAQIMVDNNTFQIQILETFIYNCWRKVS